MACHRNVPRKKLKVSSGKNSRPPGAARRAQLASRARFFDPFYESDDGLCESDFSNDSSSDGDSSDNSSDDSASSGDVSSRRLDSRLRVAGNAGSQLIKRRTDNAVAATKKTRAPRDWRAAQNTGLNQSRGFCGKKPALTLFDVALQIT